MRNVLELISAPTYSQIIDDGYKHSLIVYEDQQTRGLRLHAAVWEGELRQCPVWTAFGRSYTCLLTLPRFLVSIEATTC